MEIAIARTGSAEVPVSRPAELNVDLSHTIIAARALELRRSLLAWWEVHGRHEIPWKLHPNGSRPADGEALDPYGVFVAEVMLQQTQLAVVLPYWRRWMAAFPDLEALAATAIPW